MKKEFDLKIDGGTLESIKIDSSNSLIIATYKRDVAEFKAGDILVDDLGTGSNGTISIFKGISSGDDGFEMFDAYGDNGLELFDAYVVVDADCDSKVEFDQIEWDFIEDQRLATDEEKQLLFDALKKQGKRWNAETLELEKLDISEFVVDYESAAEYLGIKDLLPIFRNYDRIDKFNAQIKLQLIAEAWNKFDGFEADWENFDQLKYAPIFKVRDGKIEFWGIDIFRRVLDFHTSNCSFKSQERAKQFGEQFIDLFKVALGF